MAHDFNEKQMQVEPKKVRWNISKAMSCICESLKDSKLKIKATKSYATALNKLKELYGLNQTQIWILCLTCEYFIERNDAASMRDLSEIIDISAMAIMSWKKEILALIDKGILEWENEEEDFKPVNGLRDSLYSNTTFVPQPKHKIDAIEFLNYFSARYESRLSDNLGEREIRAVVAKYEYKHKNLEMIKRVSKEIEHMDSRFFLYYVANDMLRGYNSNLNSTLIDLYDGNSRYHVASLMMEEKHELFQKGFVEFSKKGNFSEAVVTLTDNGKQLILGQRASLFEDSINEKSMIKAEDIKNKKLFYSDENQKQIDRLKNALQEKTFKNVQTRLKNDGLPVGVAVLLYGAPGTGKTESVMQIAKETGRSIVHVDISETKSAWFGESEKRIKKVFTSYKHACEICEKKGDLMPILLFNEADAIISKRKDSTSGNVAQTENAIQNIILEELESMKGIFIATTNLASNMDSAFERRFLFKIKFENPSVEAKTAIWMDKLSWLGEQEARTFASGYDFSGGQIDNIARKIAMDEVITGIRPSVSEIHDMCRCEKIENTNSRRIGFGD